MGAQDEADASESNVIHALTALQRHDEAVQRGTDLLARIGARPNGANNGNLPWVLNGLLGALIDSGHLHEAHALLPRTFATAARWRRCR